MPQDWVRVAIYAPRIRRLGYNPLGKPPGLGPRKRLDIEVFRSLSLYHRHGPLLPNLKAIRWLEDDSATFPFIQLFFGPRLKSISSRLMKDDRKNTKVVDSVLGTLQQASPNLETVDFQLWDAKSGHPFSPALSLLVSDLRNLRKLSCGKVSLSESAIRHIASINTLEDLQLPNLAGQIDEWLPPESRPLFPALQFLTIPTIDLSKFSSLLRRMHPHCPRAIYVENRDCPHKASTLQAFLQSISDTCPRDSFGSLNVVQHIHIDEDDSKDFDISLSTIRPLFSLRSMVIVELEVNCPFDLDDAALTTMAQSWPKLVHLVLGASVGWGKQSKITLDGLVSLVLRCPGLQFLRIVVDATRVSEMLYSPPPIDAKNTLMESLKLGDSILDEPAEVAAVLADIFPNVQYIFAYIDIAAHDSDGESWFDKWKEVESIMKSTYLHLCLGIQCG